MKVKVEFEYVEGYLPSKRHKKLQYRDVKGETEVIINEVTGNEAPVAFRVHDFEDITEYRLWNGTLWKPVMWSDRHCGKKGLYPLDKFIKSIHYHSSYYYHKTREMAESEKHEYAANHLIIDGIVYSSTSEPRYVSMTFGLGHNHGGTSLMIDNSYNPNISKDSYFNALEREKAIAYTKERALRRGDTESINRIGMHCNIEVLIPEAVRCNPQIEHGKGDPFLNKLDLITSNSPDAMTSGLLALAMLAKEVSQ